MTRQPPGRLPDPIDAPRLRLRHWQHTDVDAIDDIVRPSIEHLRPWMPWVATEPLTRAERVTLVEGWVRDWEQGGDAYYGVFRDGQPIGACGLHHRAPPDGIEIGYWIHPDHTRRGYATELTAALTNASFGHGFSAVQVVTDQANLPSAAVPRRLGFALDRVEDREPTAPSETGRMQVWMRTTPIRTDELPTAADSDRASTVETAPVDTASDPDQG